MSDASAGQEHKLLLLGKGRGVAGLQDPQPLLSSQVVLFSLVVTKHGDSLTSAPRPGWPLPCCLSPSHRHRRICWQHAGEQEAEINQGQNKLHIPMPYGQQIQQAAQEGCLPLS